jgi:hypothetical protein
MACPADIRLIMHALRKHRWQLISEWPPLPGEKFMFHLIAGRHHESTRNDWASDGFRRVPYKDHFIILLPSWFETELEKQCDSIAFSCKSSHQPGDKRKRN